MLFRSVAEETSFDLLEMNEGDGWVGVRSNWFIAMFKHYRSLLEARDIREMILGHVGRQVTPENDACVFVRDADDVSSNMPQYMQSYCRYHFNSR